MSFIKWLCWERDCDMPFECRWVFSVACDLYFRHKKMPTLARIRRVANVRYDVGRRCLHRLAEAGLLVKGVPKYKADTFFEKSTFSPKRWWKGLHYRKVEPTGLGKRADVVHAFVRTANVKKLDIGPRYLAVCTGMPKRTVNSVIDRLINAKKLKRDGTSLIALVESNGVSMTMSEYHLHQIKLMLTDCYNDEVRNQLALAGIRNYPVLFQHFTKLKDAKGVVNYNHLLNAIKRQHPDLLAA